MFMDAALWRRTASAKLEQKNKWIEGMMLTRGDLSSLLRVEEMQGGNLRFAPFPL